jgi:hypothetical protein
VGLYQVEPKHPAEQWELTPWWMPPRNANEQALRASIVAVTGRARCIGFQGLSTNGAAQFVQVFDDDAVPANGTVPLISIPVAANALFSAYFGSRGRRFDRGIVLANSTTAASLTAGAADCLFDVQFY